MSVVSDLLSLGQSSGKAVNLPTNYRVDKDLSSVKHSTFIGEVIVNGHNILDSEQLTICIGHNHDTGKNDFDVVNYKDFIINKLFYLLSENVNNKSVWKDNLNYVFRRLEVKTGWLNTTPVISQVHTGRSKTSPIKRHKKQGDNLWHDLTDPSFKLKNLLEVIGYTNDGSKKYLFSKLGELNPDPDKVLKQFTKVTHKPINLVGTISKAIFLNTQQLTFLRDKVKISPEMKQECILKIWHNGLTDLLIGDHVYHIGFIGLKNNPVSAWIDINPKIQIAQYLNLDSGVVKGSIGTVTLDNKKYSFKFIDKELSEHFGKSSYKSYTRGGFYWYSVNGKEIPLCKEVNTGIKSFPVFYPIYDGSLPTIEVKVICNQIASIMGRFISKNCSDTVNQSSMRRDKTLRQQAKRNAVLITLYDKRIEHDPKLSINDLLKLITDNGLSVDKINKTEKSLLKYESQNGYDLTLKLVLDCRKSLQKNDYNSQEVINFKCFLM